MHIYAAVQGKALGPRRIELAASHGHREGLPEDEVVLSTAINANGTPGNESHIIHEQRFGQANQIEVDVPIQFQDQNHVWYGGVGDTTLGVKRVMFSNLDSGSILSLQGGFLIPSGNRSRGFGSGTTTFETFAAFDQLFRDRYIYPECNSERSCPFAQILRRNLCSSIPQSVRASLQIMG